MNKGEFVSLKKYVDEGKSGEIMKQLGDLIKTNGPLKPLIDFYGENKDIFERVDEWESITGMTREELEAMELQEGLELIRKKITALPIPQTKHVDFFLSPKDKVSSKLFEGKLPRGETPVATEGKTANKELTAVVTIDFNELENVKISTTITPYDREVHDAIVSLYVDGENEFVTPLMIYRTMTGNPKAKLSPTSKQYHAINESITKCSFTKIRIDAKKEAAGFNLDKLIYEGNLIYTERVIGEHKGETSEWIHVLRKPALYDYASSKGQLERTEIQLLNTPVSKNEETIILQGYLLRRIGTMKNPKSKVSKNILYETIYKQLDIQSSTPGALRKKQTKIRDTVKEILNDWIKKKFIKSYQENVGKNRTLISLTIVPE